MRIQVRGRDRVGGKGRDRGMVLCEAIVEARRCVFENRSLHGVGGSRLLLIDIWPGRSCTCCRDTPAM